MRVHLLHRKWHAPRRTENIAENRVTIMSRIDIKSGMLKWNSPLRDSIIRDFIARRGAPRRRGIRSRKNGEQYRNVISEFAAKSNLLDPSKSFRNVKKVPGVTFSIPARFASLSRRFGRENFDSRLWIGKQINQQLSGCTVARWFRSFLRSPLSRVRPE